MDGIGLLALGEVNQLKTVAVAVAAQGFARLLSPFPGTLESSGMPRGLRSRTVRSIITMFAKMYVLQSA